MRLTRNGFAAAAALVSLAAATTALEAQRARTPAQSAQQTPGAARPIRFATPVTDSLRADEPMVVARPLLGPLVQQWILPIRYTLRSAAGEPVGYLIAAAPVEMLQGYWRDAPILAKAHIAVLDDDGYLVSRYPLPAGADPAVVYGQPRSGALREYLVSHKFPKSGYAEGPNVLSMEETATVFRRLDH